ncbi:DUF4271 domain-containing protein [Mucilaginibacter flavidus]|uniref:DUF4271 domain-containing protein n=1 Tax=Mucilaginibacter flavidus TaxID=2949309 RepID=UPI0020920130|nr:DUF4271 domain-containing protein [Mucilaginibacter flavidus]MCO5946396.1 DUF4271 domain-containing protein [Mucilaginibacter flavidus]
MCFAAYAQLDSAAKRDTTGSFARRQQARVNADSVAAVVARQNRDQITADSLGMVLFKPDSLRENKFLTILYINPFAIVNSFSNIPAASTQTLVTGNVRHYRNPWLIITVIGLLIYTAFLNLLLGKDINLVFRSFYNKHGASQMDKEGGVINARAFIGLFVLFSFTFGLFLYQLTVFYGVSYSLVGFRLFIFLSVLTALLFALKFLVLKFIGFVFDVSKVVSEYIAILNLTYFNIAFVLLAVGVCFSLISNIYIQGLLFFTEGVIVIIFAWQYLRNSVNIISNIRFHKFYLFIYLCALEICPILILIKALNT